MTMPCLHAFVLAESLSSITGTCSIISPCIETSFIQRDETLRCRPWENMTGPIDRQWPIATLTEQRSDQQVFRPTRFDMEGLFGYQGRETDAANVLKAADSGPIT